MRLRKLFLMSGLVLAAGGIAARANSLGEVRSWINAAMQIITRDHLPLPYPAPPPASQWKTMSGGERLADARARLLPKLHDQLKAQAVKLGQPAFIRIFKESREFELWLKNSQGKWTLFRNYPIACFSGGLGPKTREGDMQAPEGFYSAIKKRLNPASNYHLAFNVGYPNAYDLDHQRTGSLIMVHGDMCSVGCFAMTDAVIEEIYLLVEAALKGDSAVVPIHVFPFRMTPERLQHAEAENSPHLEFWRGLKPAYEMFEASERVPSITVSNGQYRAH